MNRRRFLKIAGTSGFVVAAGAGTGLAVLGMGPAAHRPWHIAGSSYSDPMMRALSWAILAPNPHNRQPWLVDLQEDLSLVLSVDLNKMLPETDPFDRQILVGLGCFGELLRMAAAEDGYEAVFDWFPEGVAESNGRLDARPTAKVRFAAGGVPDPLFKQVLKRRSFKEPFDEGKTIAAHTLDQLNSAQIGGASIGVDNSPDFIKPMRTLTMRAMEIEFETERTYMESVDLMRIGSDEVKAKPDGIDLDGRFMMAMRYLGVVTRETLADMESSTYRQGFDSVVQTIGSTQGYLWITTPGNTREDQISAGRNYIRANLRATELGLRMHPLSQALQEYPEMADSYEQVHRLVGIEAPARLQMLTRLGYGPDIEPSPRWPVEKCIQA